MASTARMETPGTPLPEIETSTLTGLFLHGLGHDCTEAMLYRHWGEWRELSHAEVRESVERLTAGLCHLGLRKGDRVAILSENRPEWAIADYATLFAGGIVVPVYANLPPHQVSHILKDSQARAVFVSTREQMAKVASLREEIPDLEWVICFDHPGKRGGPRGYVELIDAGRVCIEKGEFPGLEDLAAKVDREDLATIIYTSGTTGDPKGVMLTHFNIASNVAATDEHRVFRLHPGLVALSFLPLSHTFERMVDYYFWYSGVTIAYVASMDRVAESMLEVRPHVLAAAPRVFEKIYAKVMGTTGLRLKLVLWAKRVGEAAVEDRISGRRPTPTGFAERLADRLVFAKLRARTGGRVQGFVSGSAPLSAEIARFFWAAGLPIYEGYGLTETSPVLAANRPGATKLGTVGQAIPGTEIRIAPDGEILARGPQIMRGYYNRPDETDKVIDADGWFHTGDVGQLDEDGFLTITDRIKDIIVTAGGKNVAPAPIENAAAMSPYVAQVVMIGDRRPFPSLLVVPDFDNVRTWAKGAGITDTSPEALAGDPRVRELIESDALGRLGSFARYEVPKKVALLPREFSVESGEMTPTLKVKRRVVEVNYSDVIESIYRGD
jgi:long-chain acyl-CoA synthetase